MKDEEFDRYIAGLYERHAAKWGKEATGIHLGLGRLVALIGYLELKGVLSRPELNKYTKATLDRLSRMLDETVSMRSPFSLEDFEDDKE